MKKVLQKIKPYLFLAPAFIMLFLFLYLSIGLAFWTALTDRTAMSRTNINFVGLGNFIKLLWDDIFWTSFRNQIIITLFAVFNSIFFPLLAAILLFTLRHKWTSTIAKSAFVLPMLVPGIVTILIWKFLYSPNFGFNSLLNVAGLNSLVHNWLNEKGTALMCIVLVGFPFVSGMYFLLFHSGINGISDELYDAARVDGCTELGLVRHIQIPGVWPYVKVVATLSLIASLSGFGQVAAMTGGGPGYNTMIPALYMYKTAFGDGKQGYASSMGVVLFFVIVGLTLITNKLLDNKGAKED